MEVSLEEVASASGVRFCGLRHFGANSLVVAGLRPSHGHSTAGLQLLRAACGDLRSSPVRGHRPAHNGVDLRTTGHNTDLQASKVLHAFAEH